MMTIAIPASESFRTFILGDRLHRRFLYAGGLITIAGFVLFKLLYPFPSLFPDSYFYILDAATGATVGYRPIGYAWLLRLVHGIHPSGLLLISLQYSFLQLCSWYFVFTLLYIFRPGNPVKKVLFAFLLFNPLYLYQSNLVSSDAVFTGLSLLWLAELLWLIVHPGSYHIILQALLVGIAFTIRYNALYYPVLTVLTLFLSRLSFRERAGGILLTGVLIASFVIFTRERNYAEIGIRQFSGFSGWQLGNNALYMYPYIKIDSSALPDREIKAINRYVRQFFDTLPPHIRITPADGALFTDGRRPLKAYMFDFMLGYPDKPEIWAYDTTSIPIRRFGKWLINHYPIQYLRYFIWPNTGVYLHQPLEKLEQFNDSAGWYGPLAQHWFNLKSERVYGASNKVQFVLMSFYAVLFFLINVFFLLFISLLAYYRKSIFPEQVHRLALIILAATFAVNAAFSILASPSVFRYQVFALVTGLFFLILAAERSIHWMKEKGWL